MAEAMFVNRNPEWRYVNKSNATQHDVSRRVAGGKTRFGQIKFHIHGKPADYVRDMKKDFLSKDFFIPDDHVASTKAYLKHRAEALTAAGKSQEAKRYWRHYHRVRPIRVTSSEIQAQTKRAAAYAQSERYATYVSLGAALTLTFGPAVWDWATGKSSSEFFVYRMGRSLSILGVGMGTDLVLANIAGSALRGTLRGHVVVGVLLTATETTWLLYEHGGMNAFYQPEFYNQISGSIGGVTLSIAGFVYGTALAAPTDPWAPVIGTLVGTVTGTIGYIGGRAVSHLMLQTLWPEILRRHEWEKITFVKNALSQKIDRLTTPLH